MTNRKLIRVLNRCQVLTSRGMCLAPINYPYYEEIQYILPMISKGAKVIEVLSDGREVELNNRNFDKDNTEYVDIPVNLEVREVKTETRAEAAPQYSSNKQKNNNNNWNNNQKNNNNNWNKQKNNNNTNLNKQKSDVVVTETEAIHKIEQPKVEVDVIEEV